MPVLTAAQFVDPINIDVLKQAVKAIVEAEAPVCVEVLTDRLCEACGIKRKTPPVKERIDYLYATEKSYMDEDEFKGQFAGRIVDRFTLNKAPDCDRGFIWKDTRAPWRIAETFRCDGDREADQVPVEEAACAAIWLARTQFGMPRDALVSETGKALGFKTSTPKVKLMCENAIEYAVGLGELTEGDHMIK